MSYTFDKPLWGGPTEEGITQSLLNLFLFCRERFRLKVILGLKETRDYNATAEFGHMWHECEEHHKDNKPWRPALNKYHRKLVTQLPEHVEDINKWHQVVQRQFQVYTEFWKHEDDELKLKPYMQEFSFRERYTPCETYNPYVILRGKIDGVDWLGKKLYLNEHKTKGDGTLDELKIPAELPCNLQTMLYRQALIQHGKRTKKFKESQVGGVRYNVIRRPFSYGSKHNIRKRVGRGKTRTGAETDKQFYDRLEQVFRDDPEHFFMRWKIELYKHDQQAFNSRVLDPLLNELCRWYEWVTTHEDPFVEGGGGVHWQTPFGIWNPLLEGRQGDYYEYLRTGSTAGLETIDELFPEL